MAITRAYSAGWGFAGTLTSAQANAVDVNTTYMLDGRSGMGDELAASIQATGSARIISTVATGPDQDTTFHVWSQSAIVRVPTLTAARTYTLGHSGATGGDRIYFYVEGTGSTASGYADISNNVGTGLFRLGYADGASGSSFIAEGDSCEVTFVGSGWQLMRGAGPSLRGRVFTSTTAVLWVCPPGVYEVILDGWGGGGGGGGGSGAGTGQNVQNGSGSGGGGALRKRVRVAVVPGRAYEALVGSGGSGGAGRGGAIDTACTDPLSIGLAGKIGGDSIFREKVSGNVLARFRGAEGGYPARSFLYTSMITTPLDVSRGGRPVYPTTTGAATFTASLFTPTGFYAALLGNFALDSTGGLGATVHSMATVGAAQYGRANIDGYAGGAPGSSGGVTNLYYGGGGGGGGGAGPGGNGAAGGAGGTASIGGVGNNGSNGSAASANSGAGGGGGGGADAGAGTSGVGGDGGSGGSGKIILTFG